MAGTYARSTDVSSGRSRDEIERTLERYGADQFLYGWQEDAAVVGFRIGGRHIRLILPLPAKTERRFTCQSASKKDPLSACKRDPLRQAA